MPPVRNRKRDYEEEEELGVSGAEEGDEEGDDMPPLVDYPADSSAQPSTYTFLAEMTPSDPQHAPATLADSGPDNAVPASFDQDSSTYILPPRTTNHGKRRDASYIPRPPNAFILFRSSFIRSQKVTGKVEGNHSNLSKIIGRLWKSLDRSEREQWEQKAQLAQAEHRKRYPDWRFRPGANALAKLKIPDPGGQPKAKRIRATKDPPGEAATSPIEFKFEESASATKSKGKGKEKASTSRNPQRGRGRSEKQDEESRDVEEKAKNGERKQSEERRIAKIADFLVEGKQGLELEVALQEWERGRKKQRRGGTLGAVGRAGSPTNVPATMGHFPVLSSASSSTPSSATGSPLIPMYRSVQSPHTAWAGSAPASPFLTSSPYPAARTSNTAIPRPLSTSMSDHRSPSPHQSQSLSSPRSRLPFHIPPGPSPLHVRSNIHDHSSEARHSPLSPHSGPPNSAVDPPRHSTFTLAAVPLTYANKRSSSAPAVDHRSPSSSEPIAVGLEEPHRPDEVHPVSQPVEITSLPDGSEHTLARPPLHGRRDTVSLPLHHSATSPTGHDKLSPSHTESPSAIRLPWQEEEDRRRHEVEYGQPIWESTHEQEVDEGDDFEPIREGDFNVLIGGEAGVSGFPQAAEGEAFSIHLPNPPPTLEDDKAVEWTNDGGSFGMSHSNYEVNFDDYATSSAIENTTYPTGDTSFAYAPISYSPTDTLASGHIHSPTFADDGTSQHFYPQAPSRLSPHTPISTFSSLAGWAGEPVQETASPTQVIDESKVSPWHPGDRSGVVQPTGLYTGNVHWNPVHGTSYSSGDTSSNNSRTSSYG